MHVVRVDVLGVPAGEQRYVSEDAGIVCQYAALSGLWAGSPCLACVGPWATGQRAAIPGPQAAASRGARPGRP